MSPSLLKTKKNMRPCEPSDKKAHHELVVYDLLTVNIMTYILFFFILCLFLKNTLP